MVEQPFDAATDQGMQVPEPVRFDEISVVAGLDEVGMRFLEEVADVGEFDDPV